MAWAGAEAAVLEEQGKGSAGLMIPEWERVMMRSRKMGIAYPGVIGWMPRKAHSVVEPAAARMAEDVGAPGMGRSS